MDAIVRGDFFSFSHDSRDVVVVVSGVFSCLNLFGNRVKLLIRCL